MAIGASIYRLNVNLSNLNSNYYEDFSMTIAKHPSESELRMMFRIVAYLYSRHSELKFTKGLSTAEEPEIWQKDIQGEILNWIELGLPDEKRIKQACGKSKQVSVFTYHPNKSLDWFEKIKNKIVGNNKLVVIHLSMNSDIHIEELAQKNMHLSCVIEDGIITLSSDTVITEVNYEILTS